jgi:hypothetical protein
MCQIVPSFEISTCNTFSSSHSHTALAQITLPRQSTHPDTRLCEHHCRYRKDWVGIPLYAA